MNFFKSDFEKDYKKLLKNVLKNGVFSESRAGDCLKSANLFLRIPDLDFYFPIVTGKKIDFKKALGEFLWMYYGRSDLAFLKDYGIHWWDPFSKNGHVEKSYGAQLRFFGGEFDQIQYCIQALKEGSRRAVLTFWNPLDFSKQSLPCCYTSFSFTKIGNRVDLAVQMRSSDLFLGLPYDICVFSLFLKHMACMAGLKAGSIFITLADAHIYKNQVEVVKKYLKAPIFKKPKLLGAFKSCKLTSYKSGPFLKVPLNIGLLH